MAEHAPKWMMGSSVRVQQNTKDQHVKVTVCHHIIFYLQEKMRNRFQLDVFSF